MGLLINIDNGGTFTDICARNDAEQVFHAKSPTTPHDLTQCFVEGLTRTAEKIYGSADLGRLLRETDYLRYSTTAGTNAVVERRGTPAALLVEADAVDDTYGARTAVGDDDLWSALVQGEPIGLDVSGIDHDGVELTARVNKALAAGAQRLVIALRSAEAERAVKAMLLEKYPRHLLGAVPFLLSYELVADDDHSRRTVTALLNSYLHPGMEHFLYGADRVCKTNRLARPLLIYRNDGNSARVAKTAAVKTWGSGPRGGIEGAVAYAQAYDARVMAAMDIGGTTTDMTVAVDGDVGQEAHGHVEGVPISFPLPTMESHGLGGSSVIRVKDGAIEIGPRSMGAVPGPACFGRGGTEVTMTDALLLAGVIDGDAYLGGTLKLDPARAAAAIDAGIARPLAIDRAEAVRRIIAAFAGKAAGHLVEAIKAKGKSPRDATLLAFGGGGPMIATAIADAAGIPRLVVPHMAAVFSAFGIGLSHLAQEYIHALQPGEDAGRTKAYLLERARRDMEGEGVPADSCTYDFSLIESDASGGLLTRATSLSDAAPEGATLSLKAVHTLPTFGIDGAISPEKSTPPAAGEARINVAGVEETVPVHADHDLAFGQAAAGPCLIRGDYLTFLIDRGWRFEVTRNRDILVEKVQ